MIMMQKYNKFLKKENNSREKRKDSSKCYLNITFYHIDFKLKKLGTIARDFNRIFLYILFFILNKKLYLCRWFYSYNLGYMSIEKKSANISNYKKQQ